MGKEGDGDLWDDSALINAFDDAISNYKIMHSKGGLEALEGKAISNTEETSSAIGEERSDAERQMLENNNNVEPTKENNSTDTYAPGHYITSSNGQDFPNANSNMQSAEDYNRLLSQYYEVEEQRQKILQQLYQNSSYDGSASYENQVPAAAQIVPWGTTATSASCPAVASCCSFACSCLVGPCASLPACCVGISESKNPCQGNSVNCHIGKSTYVRDGDLISTALGAAERALSGLKINETVISDVNKDKEGEANEGKCGQENSSSETDLSVVLNAWYSAGFYTGKYVSEQSLAKK